MIARKDMVDALNEIWMSSGSNLTDIAAQIGITRMTLHRVMHIDKEFNTKTLIKIERYIEKYKRKVDANPV